MAAAIVIVSLAAALVLLERRARRHEQETHIIVESDAYLWSARKEALRRLTERQ